MKKASLNFTKWMYIMAVVQDWCEKRWPVPSALKCHPQGREYLRRTYNRLAWMFLHTRKLRLRNGRTTKKLQKEFDKWEPIRI